MTSGPIERLIRYAYAGDGVVIPPARMTRIIRKSVRLLGYTRTIQLINSVRTGAISEQRLRVMTSTGVADPTGELAAQRVDFARAVS